MLKILEKPLGSRGLHRCAGVAKANFSTSAGICEQLKGLTGRKFRYDERFAYFENILLLQHDGQKSEKQRDFNLHFNTFNHDSPVFCGLIQCLLYTADHANVSIRV